MLHFSHIHSFPVVRENDAPASFSPLRRAMPDGGVKGRGALGAPRARNGARWTRLAAKGVGTPGVHRGGVPQRPLTPARGRGIQKPSALPWVNRKRRPAGNGAAYSPAHMSLFLGGHGQPAEEPAQGMSAERGLAHPGIRLRRLHEGMRPRPPRERNGEPVMS